MTTKRNYVIGRKYLIHYLNGDSSIGVWDGDYFKVQMLQKNISADGHLALSIGQPCVIVDTEDEKDSDDDSATGVRDSDNEKDSEDDSDFAAGTRDSNNEKDSDDSATGIRDNDNEKNSEDDSDSAAGIRDNEKVSEEDSTTPIDEDQKGELQEMLMKKRPALDCFEESPKRRRSEAAEDESKGPMMMKMQTMQLKLAAIEEDMMDKFGKVRDEMCQMGEDMKRMERENLEYRAEVERLRTERARVQEMLTQKEDLTVALTNELNVSRESAQELARIKALLKSIGV